MQVYVVYPLIFHSALSTPPSKPLSILIVENQQFQETTYKKLLAHGVDRQRNKE